MVQNLNHIIYYSGRMMIISNKKIDLKQNYITIIRFGSMKHITYFSCININYYSHWAL